MREIKFRAWDDKHKEWEYSQPMPDMGFWKWVSYNSDTIFNQWTGLKDKNGKEIFEGDIVRYIIQGVEIHPVIFADVSLAYNSPAFVIDCNTKHNNLLTKNSIAVWGIEIIGNIFENARIARRMIYDSRKKK